VRGGGRHLGLAIAVEVAGCDAAQVAAAAVRRQLAELGGVREGFADPPQAPLVAASRQSAGDELQAAIAVEIGDRQTTRPRPGTAVQRSRR
jgi:hypothetical protein